MKKKANKSGLSRIAINFIIILLIVIIGGVIFFIVNGMMDSEERQEVFNDSTLDLKISQVQKINDNTLDVTVKRNEGMGEFVALSFAVDDGALMEVIRKNVSMEELENETFSLNFVLLNSSKIKRVSVTPIFLNKDGEEIIGNMKDEYITPNVCSNYCPTGAQCGVNDCGVKCGSGCSSGYLCLNYKCIKESTSSGGGGGSSGGSSSGDDEEEVPCTDTCENLGYTCGTYNICGSSLNCGNCSEGYNCQTNGTCMEIPCTDTCNSLNYNCGNQTMCGEIVNCGNCLQGYYCNSGNCTACTTHASSNCSNGDVYWWNSCGQIEEIRYDCNATQTCVAGACVTSCTSHASSNCSNGDVYWWNSCGQIEEIRYDCNNLTETCSEGSCVVNTPSTFCGDGTCNGDETCSTCSSDCGSCPTGTVYYISTTGSDTTGTGTLSNPWKTLYKACNSVTTSGSTIYVNPGTYTETQQCVLKVGVSIMGAGDSSVITSTSITSEWNPIVNMKSSSTVNGNQVISYIKFDGSNRVASQAIDIRGRHNVKIHHCTFTNFKYVGIGWTTATATMSSSYITGSEFYNNTVINCAGYPDDWQRGALLLGGQEGMLIHDNYMVENSSSNQGLPIKFWYWDGDSKGVKIYNNYLKKTDFSGWDFAIESNYEQGMEVYNNRIVGALDLNYQIKGSYDYSVYVHDNVIGPDGPISYWHGQAGGIILEFGSEAVIIERNLIVNASPCFLFTPRTEDITGITIRYNICKDIGTSGYYFEGLRVVEPSNIEISQFYMYNNILQGYSASALGNGISISTGGSGYTGSDMQFINNIIMNFGNGAPLIFSTSSINGLFIQNNVFYSNGNNNQPQFSGTPTNYTNSGNVISNPLFVGLSSGNFHLQSSSPAINVGKNIGLTSDFEKNSVPVGSAPDIGAYEYH